MKRAYSEESLSAVQVVVRAMRTGDSLTWAKLSDLFGVSRGRLQAFMDLDTAEVPKIPAMRSILEGIEKHVRENPDTNVKQLCPSELGIVLGRLPGTLDIVKAELNLDDADQERLSTDASGNYIAVRPWEDRGVFVGHVRVFDRYGKDGMPICHMRRRLTQGGDLSVTAAVFRKSPKLYVVGHETNQQCVRTMSLHQHGGRFDLLTGIMSGFESNGNSFASKIVVAKLSELHTFSSFRERTGIYEDLDSLDELVQEVCRKPEEVLPQLSFGQAAYLKDEIGG